MTINTSPSQLRELAVVAEEMGWGTCCDTLLAVAKEKEAQVNLLNDLVMAAQERGFREGLKTGSEKGAQAMRDRVYKNIFGE